MVRERVRLLFESVEKNLFEWQQLDSTTTVVKMTLVNKRGCPTFRIF